MRIPTILVRPLLVAALALGASVSARAYVIDFSNIGGLNQDPYSGHLQGDFAVSTPSGPWFKAHVFGNPVPSVFLGPIGAPPPGTLQVNNTLTGLFTFSSVDISSNTAAGSTFLIEGFLNNALVFSLAGGIPNVSTFNTFSLNGPSTTLDMLSISLTPGSGTTSMNVDNIVVDTTRTNVPDAASSGLLAAAGLALLGFFRRRLA